MKCTRCGTDFDSAFCPNCGTARPLHEPLSIDSAKSEQKNPMGVWAFIVSLFTLLAANSARYYDTHWVDYLFLGISIILVVLAFKAAKERNLKRGLTITALIFCCVSAALLLPVLINDLNDNDVTRSETSASERTNETTSSVTNTPTPTPAPTPTPLTVDSLVAMCEEIPYKDIMRNPDDYTARYITVTLKISQVMDERWLDDKVCYRCYSDNSGYEFYFDDEYYVVDYRPEGSMKLLKGDVITIYGQVIGVEELTRALTWTNDEVVSITMLYCELIDE